MCERLEAGTISICGKGAVKVSGTTSLFAFSKRVSWGSTRWDCLRDFEAFEDSLLEAGLFIRLHFAWIMR